MQAPGGLSVSELEDEIADLEQVAVVEVELAHMATVDRRAGAASKIANVLTVVGLDDDRVGAADRLGQQVDIATDARR